MKKPETHVVAIAIVLFFSVVNIVKSYTLYTSAATSQQSDGVESSLDSTGPQSESGEAVSSLFVQDSLDPATYQPIGTNNLFAKDRTAWQAPLEEQSEAEQPVEVLRKDVVLYGTFRMGDKKGAVLEFPTMKTDQRKKTVIVGDPITFGSDSGKSDYTLISVGASSVELRGPSGKQFTVELYGKKNKKNNTSPVAKKTISVDSSNVSSATKAAITTVGKSSFAAEADKIAKTRELNAQKQKKIESGELRKVSTPFGTAYVKNKK